MATSCCMRDIGSLCFACTSLLPLEGVRTESRQSAVLIFEHSPARHAWHLHAHGEHGMCSGRGARPRAPPGTGATCSTSAPCRASSCSPAARPPAGAAPASAAPLPPPRWGPPPVGTRGQVTDEGFRPPCSTATFGLGQEVSQIRRHVSCTCHLQGARSAFVHGGACEKTAHRDSSSFAP